MLNNEPLTCLLTNLKLFKFAPNMMTQILIAGLNRYFSIRVTMKWFADNYLDEFIDDVLG